MKADRELIALAKTKPIEALADHSRRPPKSIIKKAKRLGLSMRRIAKGYEMRIFAALLIVLAVLYFWDVNYNRGALSDGVIHMGQSMLHHLGH
jgi:hypothetical protein